MEDRIYTNEEAEILFRKQYKEILTKAEIKNNQKNKKESEYYIKINSKCQKCESENINDRIKQIKGESEISCSLHFLDKHLSLSSSIDTHEVNKCNDCNHEWKKYKRCYFSIHDIFDSELNSLTFSFNSLLDNSDFIYDKKDWSNKYNSQEEADKMFEAHISNIFVYYGNNICHGVYPEVIKKLINKYSIDYSTTIVRFNKITKENWKKFGHTIIDYPNSPFCSPIKNGFFNFIKKFFTI